VIYSANQLITQSSRLSHASIDAFPSMPNNQKYNALVCSPQLEFNPTSGIVKGQIKRGRTIKIKNVSMNSTAFCARAASNSPDVEISSTEGFITGNGGVLDLCITATPRKSGVFEDVIIISVAGSNGKVYRVPIKFEGKIADVAIEESGDDDIKDGILVGSWGSKDLTMQNRGIVNARVIFDLRRLPHFRIRWKPKSLDFASAHTGTTGRVARRVSTSSGRRVSTSSNPNRPLNLDSNYKKAPGIKFSKKPLDDISKKIVGITVISPADPIYAFDRNEIKCITPAGVKTRMTAITEDEEEDDIVPITVIRDSQTDSIAPTGSIYVFDLVPGEAVDIQLVFKPLDITAYNLDLPVHVIGNPINQIVHLITESIPSPLSMSISNINFKNKVVFKQLALTANSTYIAPSTSKEIVILKNCLNGPLRLWFDVRSLEESSVFSIEPTQAVLEEGESLKATVLFKPETAGVFTADVPLYVDKLGQKVPFQLSMSGTGVEPSLAVDPPELYLPMIPVGETATSIFHV
jgi:hypothetical protein